MADIDQGDRVAVSRPPRMSDPWLASGAGARAEAATVGARVPVGHERGPALLATTPFASQSRAALDYAERFIVSDGAFGVQNVAPLARRGQILQAVIRGIPVEMVNDKDPFTASAARHPLHGGSAVVTRVGSATNGGIEDHAVFGHEGPAQRKRMIRGVDHSARRGLFLATARVGALLGAVLAGLGGDTSERGAALLAGVLYLAAQAVGRAGPGAEASSLPARPIAEFAAALFALRGGVLAAASSRADPGAVLAYLRLSAAGVLTPALITVPRSRRHA